ncbi:phosphate ABC transporter permease subunit PstC [Formicincola oecophyllae]|uniref:Phosphate transport system permease protein n=1 Tax=Formicincola oecophyllae TaxID=2558361 RepID=A0A4Y6UAJ3_9PROT|nr:phosphate ABC transporter permease subunit PstC [Formicincola oecophyllae]QDH13467.1 phosphate ABC transporter permease subunit PstC [Formicincola oecophyllae]
MATATPSTPPPKRSALTSGPGLAGWIENGFRGGVTSCALLVAALLGALALMLAMGGWNAFRTFGPAFLVDGAWDPVAGHYGALAPLLGTVLSSVLALLIAVPLAFGTAFWLTTIAPRRLSKPIAMAVQLLAAVPSIIFGMWGFFMIVPFMARHVQPWLDIHLAHVPLLGALTGGAAFGLGLMTTALVLALMVAPFVTAVMCDVFNAVPPMMVESAYGLGATRWEVIRFIILPWCRNGLIGALVLGMGRALGETIAVTFVIGNVTAVGWSLFAPRSTAASLIALQFPESPAGSLGLSALLALGFILMALSCGSLVMARLLTKEAK